MFIQRGLTCVPAVVGRIVCVKGGGEPSWEREVGLGRD